MGELNDLAASVAAILKERGDTIAVSESSCGGLISAALVSIPGASAYYVGGSVVYTRTAQQGLLQVPDSAMEGHRASTEYYALLNARTSREIMGTTWASGGNRRQWPHRQPLRRQLRTRLLRRSRPGGTLPDAGNRQPRPGGQHVGLRPHRSRLAGRRPQGCVILQSTAIPAQARIQTHRSPLSNRAVRSSALVI